MLVPRGTFRPADSSRTACALDARVDPLRHHHDVVHDAPDTGNVLDGHANRLLDRSRVDATPEADHAVVDDDVRDAVPPGMAGQLLGHLFSHILVAGR